MIFIPNAFALVLPQGKRIRNNLKLKMLKKGRVKLLFVDKKSEISPPKEKNGKRRTPSDLYVCQKCQRLPDRQPYTL